MIFKPAIAVDSMCTKNSLSFSFVKNFWTNY